MKILQVGIGINKGASGCHALNIGLTQNNHSVENFEYRRISNTVGQIKMNNLLISDAIKFDILIIGKGELIFSNTLKIIKELNTHIKIILWYGDQRNELQKFILDLLPYVDLFLHTTGGNRLYEYYNTGKPKMAANFIVPTDMSIFNYQNEEKTNDIIFTGQNYSDEGDLRKDIKMYLSDRTDAYLYGFNLPAIHGINYINELKKSKIGININDMHKYDKYSSDRLTHYLSCNIFVLSKYSPGMEELFVDGVDLVYFYEFDDFKEKLEYYLNHDDEREKIALNGMNKIYNNFNSKIITEEILNILYHSKKTLDWIELIK